MLNLFFPQVCHLCGDHLIGDERFVCSLCRSELPRSLFGALPFNPMEEKLVGGPYFRRATALLLYEHGGAAATLIHDFKYRCFPSLAEEMGRMMANELFSTGFFSETDLLIPIPLGMLKEMRRGYNQAEMLARGVSAELRIPIADNLRVKPHRTQTRLNPFQREENMKGLFRVIEPGELSGKRVMIIDDVCTTGATLRSAASALEPYVAEINYLALATTV